MKKKILSLLCAAAAILVFPAVSMAGSHEKTLGIGGGYATHNHSGYGKLYFQYSIIPLIRVAPEIGYVFPHKDASGFEASIDFHFPFRIAKGVKFYPLAGFTYNNWSNNENPRIGRGGFDIGGGFDLYLTQSLKLSLQGKYSAMKDTSGGFFDIGIGYVF